MEEWKEIEGYPNYMVSSLGRVKSLNYRRTGKDKILNGRKNKDGYLQLNLCKDGKIKMFSAHRLVAQSFLDNPDNLCEINHIDEDKTNNKVENLEWCNRKQNCNHRSRNERIAKSHSKPILQFNKEGDFIRKWESTTQVKRELGFNQGNISSCCKGKLKLTRGYKWGYADDYEKIPFKVFDLEIYKKKIV